MSVRTLARTFAVLAILVLPWTTVANAGHGGGGHGGGGHGGGGHGGGGHGGGGHGGGFGGGHHGGFSGGHSFSGGHGGHSYSGGGFSSSRSFSGGSHNFSGGSHSLSHGSSSFSRGTPSHHGSSSFVNRNFAGSGSHHHSGPGGNNLSNLGGRGTNLHHVTSSSGSFNGNRSGHNHSYFFGNQSPFGSNGHSHTGNWSGHSGNWSGSNWAGHHNGNWNGHHGNNGNWGGNFGRSSFFGYYPFGLGYGLGGYGYGLGGYGSGWGGYGYGGYGSPGYGYGGDYGYGGYYPSTTAGAAAPVYDNTVPLTDSDAVPQTAGSFDDFASQGEDEFRAGRYQDSIRSWRHALLDDPQNGGLLLLMSQSMFQLGKFDEAAGAMEMGLSMLPDDKWGTVVSNYTQLYGNMQDYTDRLKALEKARDAKPDSPALRVLIGYHFGYLGYPKQAVQELDKAVQLEKRDPFAAQLRNVFAAKLGLDPIPVPMPPKEDQPPGNHPPASVPPASPPTAAPEKGVEM